MPSTLITFDSGRVERKYSIQRTTQLWRKSDRLRRSSLRDFMDNQNSWAKRTDTCALGLWRICCRLLRQLDVAGCAVLKRLGSATSEMAQGRSCLLLFSIRRHRTGMVKFPHCYILTTTTTIHNNTSRRSRRVWVHGTGLTASTRWQPSN
jgi:hypothetical protein